MILSLSSYDVMFFSHSCAKSFFLVYGFAWYWQIRSLVVYDILVLPLLNFNFIVCPIVVYLKLVFLFGPGKTAFVNCVYVISFAWADQNQHSSCKCDFLFILLFRPTLIIQFNWDRVYGFRILVGPTKNV
jgi:hypothetical protein